MDWNSIISNALRSGISPAGDHLRPGRHRPQPALRLHRSAQLRPGRVHGGRRLRRRHHDRHARRPVVGRASSSVWRPACVLGLILGRPDAATTRRLPRHRDDRRRRDHPLDRARGHAAATSPVGRTASTASPTASRTGIRSTTPGRYGFRLFGRINLEFSGADVWELARRLEPGAAVACCSCGCSSTVRGAGCSSRSARTRTPPRRSARTCSGSRCSR